MCRMLLCSTAQHKIYCHDSDYLLGYINSVHVHAMLNKTFILTYVFHLRVDPIVRSELMEQIPHVAVYCQENRDIFQNAIPVYILPMVVRYLDDANNQVFT